jgi:hypothetical protein
MGMAILLLIDNHLLLYKIEFNTIILAYVDIGLMDFCAHSDPDGRFQKRPLAVMRDLSDSIKKEPQYP